MADLKFRRRDMIEAEQVAGEPLGKLFVETDDGEKVATALGSLAIQYVIERRNGLTDLEFDGWLDQEQDGIEIEFEPDPS